MPALVNARFLVPVFYALPLSRFRPTGHAPLRAQVEVLAGTTGTANRTLSRFGIELPAGRPADRSDRSPGRVTPARSTAGTRRRS